MENVEKKTVDQKEQCFVMMPISDQGDYPKGHFDKVYEQIFRPAIEEAGFEPYRVDENSISDSIIGKIFKAIQESPMALCDLSNRNPNVLYELGIRQAYDKPVILVQDEKTEKIFDISGISTVFYKSDRIFEHVMEARKQIAKAISETREGRRESIVRIANAYTAEISAEKMTKEDKIEIMLSGLVEDVRSLKKSQNIDVDSECRIDRDKFAQHLFYALNSENADERMDRGDLIKDRNYGKRHGIIRLKPGIMDEQIENAVERIQEVYDDIEIEYHRLPSNSLEVTLYGKNNIPRIAMMYLRKTLEA